MAHFSISYALHIKQTLPHSTLSSHRRRPYRIDLSHLTPPSLTPPPESQKKHRTLSIPQDSPCRPKQTSSPSSPYKVSVRQARMLSPRIPPPHATPFPIHEVCHSSHLQDQPPQCASPISSPAPPNQPSSKTIINISHSHSHSHLSPHSALLPASSFSLSERVSSSRHTLERRTIECVIWALWRVQVMARKIDGKSCRRHEIRRVGISVICTQRKNVYRGGLIGAPEYEKKRMGRNL